MCIFAYPFSVSFFSFPVFVRAVFTFFELRANTQNKCGCRGPDRTPAGHQRREARAPFSSGGHNPEPSPRGVPMELRLRFLSDHHIHLMCIPLSLLYLLLFCACMFFAYPIFHFFISVFRLSYPFPLKKTCVLLFSFKPAPFFLRRGRADDGNQCTAPTGPVALRPGEVGGLARHVLVFGQHVLAADRMRLACRRC